MVTTALKLTGEHRSAADKPGRIEILGVIFVGMQLALIIGLGGLYLWFMVARALLDW